MSKIYNEEDLVQRAKDDLEVFGEIYEHYFNQIYRYVFSKVRSHAETEDIVSDTFLKALHAFSSYTPSGRPLVVWLYRIAHNTTIDYYRKSNREVKVDWLEQIGEEAELDAIEHRHWLEQAMENLTESQQTVLRLHYLEDMKFKDIAHATKKTEGAVKATALRAITRLRSIMLKEGEKYAR